MDAPHWAATQGIPTHPPSTSRPQQLNLKRLPIASAKNVATSAAHLLPALAGRLAEATLDRHQTGFTLIKTAGSKLDQHGGDSLTALVEPHR
jgi:hypothetical protein